MKYGPALLRAAGTVAQGGLVLMQAHCKQRVNAVKYRDAQSFVTSGTWRVDVENGVVYGKWGKPIGSPSRLGYLVLGLFAGGQMLSVFAHRVIWESVYGAIADGMQINHMNGDKLDNRLENLEVVTASDNVRHSVRTGLARKSLGVEDVRAIRSMVRAGQGSAVIAEGFGISSRYVGDIARGARWGKTMEPSDDVSKITRSRILDMAERRDVVWRLARGDRRENIARDYGTNTVTIWRIGRRAGFVFTGNARKGRLVDRADRRS